MEKETDKRENVEIDLSEVEILQLALEAHRRDITLNKMVEIILQEAIEHHKAKEQEPKVNWVEP